MLRRVVGMARRQVKAVLIVLFLMLPVARGYATAEMPSGVGTWAEIFNDLSYRTTNFSDNSPTLKGRNYVMNALVVKAGLRREIWRENYGLTEYLMRGVYLDIYGKGELTYDFLNKPWNNRVF